MPAALSGSRRPLFQREGQLAGFEFMVAGAYAQRLARRTDPVAYAAHAAALMGSVRATLATRRVALLSLPLSVATRPSVLTQLPAGALLALTDVDPRREEDVAALLLLRPSGVRLGGIDQAIPGGSFVLLDGAQLGDDTLAESVAHWRHTQPEQRVLQVPTALQRRSRLLELHCPLFRAPRSRGLGTVSVDLRPSFVDEELACVARLC